MDDMEFGFMMGIFAGTIFALLIIGMTGLDIVNTKVLAKGLCESNGLEYKSHKMDLNAEYHDLVFTELICEIPEPQSKSEINYVGDKNG